MWRCSAATAAASATPAARLNECPLGAGALAGTSFPIDRHMTAKAMGFDRPTRNSLDTVPTATCLSNSAAASICAVHLSRLAEEIVIWMSAPSASSACRTAGPPGSRMMPQKRNPDAAELVRGKTGRVIGSLSRCSPS